LETIRIQQELDALLKEQSRLEEVLNSPAALNRLMLREIEQDAKAFADDRRTLIQAEKRVATEVKVVDEPVTVVISEKGWVRARTGHGHLPESFTFKPGDALYGTFACRTVDTLLMFGNTGRVYSVPVAALPSGRGDGQPVSTLVEVEPGTAISHYFAGPPGAKLLLSSSGGYGFIASVENMTTRLKAGKSFINCAEGESICRPGLIGLPTGDMVTASFVAAASTLGRLLTFEVSELREMPSGGRGLMLLDLEGKDTLAGATPYSRSIQILGIGRGGKEREETLEIRSLNNALGKRARKGKAADFGFKPHTVLRVL
jgi:topoisomerase-4 subunit A